jgi:hypothetical protein
VKGTVSTKGEEWTDFCWNYDLGNYGSCEGNEGGCVLAEHSCKDYWDDTYGYGWKEKYDCPNGCQDGACIKGACGEIEWQKVIGSGIPDYLRSIIQTLDGGYVVVGRYNSSGYVMKLNNIGDVEWSRPFSGDAYALSVDQTSNGGYVILTNKNNVIKLDSNGNIDWINDMVGGFSGASPKSIEQTSDGGYIFVDGSDTNFHIVKIINATSIEWERIFDTSTTDIGNSIAQTSDGGYIVAGMYDHPFKRYPYILKLDGFGNLEWNKTYIYNNEPIISIEQTGDEGYVFGTLHSPSGFIYKLDGNGNIIWRKNSNEAINPTVTQTSDGGYVAIGQTGGGASSNCSLEKLDSNGNIEWLELYDKTEEYGCTGQQTSDGGYIIGSHTNDALPSRYDFWILKIKAC